MKRYRLTPKAQQDLSAIWDHTAENWGAAQAECYVREIEAAFSRFGENPGLALNANHIRSGYFRFRVGSHIFFFRRGAEWIEVVRILHGAMDFSRHL